MSSERMTASVSLDMDNLWSYMKVHGDPEWEDRPSYLPALAPRLLEVLGENDLTSTVFVVGADAAREDGAKAVAAISAAGHEIANHSYEHEPWLGRYSRAQLEEELERAEDAIVAAGAPRPVGFRGPGFSLSPTLVDVLEQRGYRYDCSTLPTWIGPLARAYYFRSTDLAPEEREQRESLFGAARDVLQPNHPYRWTGVSSDLGPMELPVTTVPLLRLPMHLSYILHLHGLSPRLAKSYFSAALRLCRLRGVGPSLLLHPLDMLDGHDAPRLQFFPGMALAVTEKLQVVNWALGEFRRHFDVVGTGEHVTRLVSAGVGRRRTIDSMRPGAGGRPT